MEYYEVGATCPCCGIGTYLPTLNCDHCHLHRDSTAAIKARVGMLPHMTPLDLRRLNVPPFVMRALADRATKQKYSRLKEVFHCVWLSGASDNAASFECAGVVGDGDNGSYEMFRWENGKLTCSDEGWGNTTTPLLMVLCMVVDTPIRNAIITLETALKQTGCDGDLCAYAWHEDAHKALEEIRQTNGRLVS